MDYEYTPRKRKTMTQRYNEYADIMCDLGNDPMPFDEYAEGAEDFEAMMTSDREDY